MPEDFRGQPDAGGGRPRLPRWLVDDRFDAAMTGIADGGRDQELPDTGLAALAIPLLAIGGWALILGGIILGAGARPW